MDVRAFSVAWRRQSQKLGIILVCGWRTSGTYCLETDNVYIKKELLLKGVQRSPKQVHIINKLFEMPSHHGPWDTCQLAYTQYSMNLCSFTRASRRLTLCWLCYLDSSLGDADGLLLHGFMNGHLVLQVHLVKLVNTAHTLESNNYQNQKKIPIIIIISNKK